MLIDWMSLSTDASLLDSKTVTKIADGQDRIMRVSPEGEVKWVVPCRANIRSDSHQITVRIGSHLDIQGSPARTKGTRDNVFGEANPVDAFLDMVQFLSNTLEVSLPCNPTCWRLTRLDVTGNFDLGSLPNVRQALNYLRHVEGGRYQVKTEVETVYWAKSSRLRAGKAYAKGPHMRHLVKKGQVDLTLDQLSLVDQLLRLELRLGNQFWRERAAQRWYRWSSEQLYEQFTEYFGQFIGKVEVVEVDKLLDALMKVAPTPGLAKAAYRTWALIQSHGVEKARELTTVSTWQRHKRLLQNCGISWADFHHRALVPFRRKTIVLSDPVRSWEDLIARSQATTVQPPEKIKPKLKLIQGKTVAVECVLCKVQFSGREPGLNQCPRCGSHFHVRVVSGVDLGSKKEKCTVLD